MLLFYLFFAGLRLQKPCFVISQLSAMLFIVVEAFLLIFAINLKLH